jgi:hypothetical protein
MGFCVHHAAHGYSVRLSDVLHEYVNFLSSLIGVIKSLEEALDPWGKLKIVCSCNMVLTLVMHLFELLKKMECLREQAPELINDIYERSRSRVADNQG